MRSEAARDSTQERRSEPGIRQLANKAGMHFAYTAAASAHAHDGTSPCSAQQGAPTTGRQGTFAHLEAQRGQPVCLLDKHLDAALGDLHTPTGRAQGAKHRWIGGQGGDWGVRFGAPKSQPSTAAQQAGAVQRQRGTQGMHNPTRVNSGAQAEAAASHLRDGDERRVALLPVGVRHEHRQQRARSGRHRVGAQAERDAVQALLPKVKQLALACTAARAPETQSGTLRCNKRPVTATAAQSTRQRCAILALSIPYSREAPGALAATPQQAGAPALRPQRRDGKPVCRRSASGGCQARTLVLVLLVLSGVPLRVVLQVQQEADQALEQTVGKLPGWGRAGRARAWASKHAACSRNVQGQAHVATERVLGIMHASTMPCEQHAMQAGPARSGASVPTPHTHPKHQRPPPGPPPHPTPTPS